MRYRILFCVLAVLAVAGNAGMLFLYARVEQAESAIQRNMLSLEEQIAAIDARLTGKISEIAEKSGVTSLSLEELKRRQQIRAESREDQLVRVVGNAVPAVASIVVSKEIPQVEIEYVNPFGNDPFFHDSGVRIPVYRQRGVVEQRVSSGTGFIITSDGYLITNRHVVADTSVRVTAFLSDGTSQTAAVIYRDPIHDVALLKISGAFNPIPLGDSARTKLGQTVIAIGNALGELENTVSVGIVSGLDRTIEASDGKAVLRIEGVIQTDAAINRGNSGGPLLDFDGRAMGVNVATVVGSENISFAIPINVVRSIASNLIGRNL